MTPVYHQVPNIKQPNAAVFLVQVYAVYKGKVVQEQIIHFDQALSPSGPKSLQEAATVPATVFNLRGGGMELTLKLGGAGGTTIDYRDAKKSETFQGRGIVHEQARLGRLLSVVLSFVPDSETVVLTLAVPDVNRPVNAKSISVATFAVRTLIKDTIVGPAGLQGQVQTYETIALEGNAW